MLRKPVSPYNYWPFFRTNLTWLCQSWSNLTLPNWFNWPSRLDKFGRACFTSKSSGVFWGVSDPLCLSSSLALHFFQLFFLGPPPCQPRWPATPCACNGLWLLSCMAVSLKENNCFFVTDQTPRPMKSSVWKHVSLDLALCKPKMFVGRLIITKGD
jgi:hypothetical protein